LHYKPFAFDHSRVYMSTPGAFCRSFASRQSCITKASG